MNKGSLVAGAVAVGALAVAFGPSSNITPTPAPIHSGIDTTQRRAFPRIGDRTTAKGYMSGRDLLEVFLGQPLGGTTDSSLELDVVITTLPDPYDSRLDWTYDGAMEGLVRAFERSGYVSDRFWLPDQFDSVRVPVGHPVETIAQTADSVWVTAREAFPGVFLFRKHAQGMTQLRLLYLVPELPTGGVYRAVLARALAERASLMRSGSGLAAVDRSTVRIVGPTFSGSAYSLRRGLDRWLAENSGVVTSVSVVSGSATNPGNQDRFSANNRTGPTISFHATVNSDAVYMAVLRDSIVRSLGLADSLVALLSESSTEYGQGATRRNNRSMAESNEPSYLRISFPMNISRVRAEYARHPDPSQSDQFTMMPITTSRVSLSLAERERPKETPPARSNLTPAAVDLLIEQIVHTLLSHRIRLVGILATDVRDKLFLAQEIRRRMRDVQLFTFESNILFLRRDLNQYMHGMYVVSTYPLVPENKDWVGDASADERIPFPNDGAEGFFNATLIQLGNDSMLMEYRAPGDNVPVAPPVWITRVGRTSMIPVSFREADSNNTYLARPDLNRVTPHSPESRPTSHQFSFTVEYAYPSFCVLVGILALWITSSCRSRWRDFDTVWAKRPYRGESGSLRPWIEVVSLLLHREMYLALLLVCILGVFVPIATPLFAEALRGNVLSIHGLAYMILPLVVTLTLTTALAVTIVLALMVFAGSMHDGWSLLRLSDGTKMMARIRWGVEVFVRFCVAALGIVGLTLILMLGIRIWSVHSPTDASWWIFYQRWIQLDSGVSPALPLILAGFSFTIWAYWHSRRIKSLLESTPFEEYAIGSSNGVCGGEGVREVRTRVCEMRNRLFLLLPTIRAGVFFGVLVILIGGLAPQLGIKWELQTVDSIHKLLFGLCVLGCIASVAWASYRLISIWSGLSGFLGAVSKLPLVTAFDRLPPRIARLTGLSVWRGSPANPVEGAIEIQWQQLKSLYDQCLNMHKTESEDRDEDKLLPSDLNDNDEKAVLACMRCFLSPEDAACLDLKDRDHVEVGGLGQLHRLLETAWSMEPASGDLEAVRVNLEKSGAGARDQCTSGRFRQTFSTPLRLWLRLGEEHFAVRIVEYVETVLDQLRRLALSLLGSMLLTTALLSSYPFHPQSRIKLIFFFILLGTVASVIAVMMQMSRDEVLSRIAKTEPGKITWDSGMAFGLLVFATLPLLYLVSSEFPTVNHALTSWMEPAMNVLRLM